MKILFKAAVLAVLVAVPLSPTVGQSEKKKENNDLSTDAFFSRPLTVLEFVLANLDGAVRDFAKSISPRWYSDQMVVRVPGEFISPPHGSAGIIKEFIGEGQLADTKRIFLNISLEGWGFKVAGSDACKAVLVRIRHFS